MERALLEDAVISWNLIIKYILKDARSYSAVLD
jgi:hypothetical protein